MFRRSHPVPVVAVVAVLELGVTLLHPWGSNVSAGLWFALYAVAAARSRRFALVCLAAATAPLVIVYFLLAVGPLDGRLPDMGVNTPENFQLITSIAAAVSIALSNVIATGLGVSVRQRREHEHEIAAWAARAAQLGSVTERNRIAREMHDVVAHSLTVMVSLADGAAVVVKKDPARAAEVLGELSRTGRTALADMRRVLGVLRDDSAPGQAPREPLAAADSLGKLLEGFRTAGLPLHYTHTGPSLPDDAAFQLTVYRIVQESLTNVLRYGRSLGRVDVAIARNGPTVTIDVVDDGKGTVDAGGSAAAPAALKSAGSVGTGRGLAGMLERARIYAGTVEAGRSAITAGACTPCCTGTATTEAKAHESRRTDGRDRTDPHPAGGRPAAPEDGFPPDPGGRGRSGDCGRGLRRRRGDPPGPRARARRGADGRADAGPRRDRGHAGHHHVRGRRAGHHPHHLRPRRVRVRRAPGRGLGLPAQGRGARRTDQCRPRGGER